MLHDHLETPSTVDAKTAEEALALALRLQQEHGERVSLEELQQTADEAGIDRVYLQGALKQVTEKAQRQAQQQAEVQEALPLENRRIKVMAIACGIAVLVALVGRMAPEVLDSPGFIAAFIIAAVTARKIVLGNRCGSSRRRFRGR